MSKLRDSIVEMREEGKTYTEIKNELGCSLGTISYYCGIGQREKTKKRGRDRRTQKVRYTQKLKQNTPCADCGVNYPYWVMDFDHRPTEEKLFNISVGSRGLSLEKVQLEIDKCDIVCANCHRDRTHARIEKDGSQTFMDDFIEE